MAAGKNKGVIMDEKKFEKILDSRKFEEPSPDLVRKIIVASLSQKKKPGFSIVAWFADIINEINLSKPVFAAVPLMLAIVLIAGLTIGFSNPVEKRIAVLEQINLQDFLYVKGELP